MAAPRTPFLDAFRDAATAVIHALPNNLDDATASSTTRDLLSEVSTNQTKLWIVVCVIFDKAMANEEWIMTAAKLYKLVQVKVSPFVKDPNFTDRNTGTRLVRRYVSNLCWIDFFNDYVKEVKPTWSATLLRLMAEVTVTDAVGLGILSVTSSIEVLQHLAESAHLSEARNFDLFADYVRRVGPRLDEKDESEQVLTRVLDALVARKSTLPGVCQLRLSSLLRIRENGWKRWATQGSN